MEAAYDKLMEYAQENEHAIIKRYLITYSDRPRYVHIIFQTGIGIAEFSSESVKKLFDLIDELDEGTSVLLYQQTLFDHRSGAWTEFRLEDGTWSKFGLLHFSDFWREIDCQVTRLENLRQKRTTLFWELLTRVDQTPQPEK